MNELWERPLPIVLTGAAVLAVLGFVWWQLRRRVFLVGGGLVVAATVGLLIAEHSIHTPREQIRDTLYTIADLIERNDFDGALQFVHESFPTLTASARAELDHYQFHHVTIKNNLEILLDDQRAPQSATLRFNAVVVLSDDSGMLHNRTIPRFVIVTMQRQSSGEWRVSDYEHHDPREGFRPR